MAVPKIFQTFNSLLGGIVRKRNATIVGPSKQLVGEFPEVDFERLYQYYDHWDQIKTAVDVMHQKFRGSGIEITSNNEYFNTIVEKWWDVSNSEKKWSQYIFSLLITGSAIMELQYTPDQRLGNVEQIPMQTIYRLFRDQFGNELKIVQIVDGVFKELDPQYFIHSTINNPSRQAFGKSMFHTLASPRPITGTVDSITGEAINPERNSMPLLDSLATVQNQQIEIFNKMAKPRLIVGANGMPRDQMEKLEEEMSDPNNDKYIWIFNKPIESAELQIQANGKFEDYTKSIDEHIDLGTVFASNVIKNPQSFSYSGAQSPLDVLDQRMIDLQSELIETIKDRLLKPLAESWGFKDFDAMEVVVQFTPTMKRLTMEDIRGLDPEAVSKKEVREMYKKLNIPLDDQLWDEQEQELKQDKQDQKEIQMQGAMIGIPPAEGGDKPFKDPLENEEGDKPASGIKAPTTPEAEITPPKPTTEQTPQPSKESVTSRIIKEIATESNMSDQEKFEAIRAVERIPLPPKAGDNGNSSSDLYVSQGIDDEADKPEITDPAIRDIYGIDKEDVETPPTDPAKMARAGDRPSLTPADNAGGRFTNSTDQGIGQIPEVSKDEYLKHLEASNNGNAIQGGTGNDGINEDSDGSFKDPIDANNDMEVTPETGNTDNPMPHAGPNQPPLVNNPNDLTLNISGGSDPTPNNTKDQVLGGNDGDENPIVPSEGFEPDYNEEELKKKEDRQNLGEAVSPTMYEKPLPQVPSPPQNMHRDIIEGEDPLTSGTGTEPTPDLNNQPQKGQARLDDTPLQIPNANKGNINGIDPSRAANNTNEEMPEALANDGNETPVDMVPPFDKMSDNLGDSGQVRLKEEELTGELQDQPLENNSDNIQDNTGLNVKPEFKQVSEDDYMKQVQDGSNPLENRGDPLEDGMIIKPEDVQQHGGITDPSLNGDGLSGTPETPEGMTAINQDPNTINDPTDSGIDEEDIDPNILHTDPETNINYTDLTDEQGNEVPDLRFDQTPSSDEEQPQVELEYEIVTEDEYEDHLDASKGQMTQDQFNQELDAQSTDDEAPNPFGLDQSKDQLDPAASDLGGASEEPTSDSNINDSNEKPKEESSNKEDKSSPKSNPDETDNLEQMDNTSIGNGEPEETKEESPKPKKETPKKPKGEEPKKKEKSKSEPKKKEEKPKEKEDDDGEIIDEEEAPKRKGSVKDIIKREHELIDQGVNEEEVHNILEDEFGEERIEKAEETKIWRKRKL